jgi:hypothetical protein
MTIKRSRAELFSYIGAPLNNVQWSWGAVRETDGSVFLVVWQDENLRRGTRSYSLVHNQEFWGNTTDRHGLNERRRHLDRVRQGAKTYLIMALAERPRTADAPRRIKELNTDDVFAAGELYEDDTGNVWIERVARVPLVEVRVPPGTPLQQTD